MPKHYFISDLHLGAAYVADHRAHEQRVTRFLDTVKGDAASLWLLGDVLDYWFEYRKVVPRGHVRFLGKLAELADAGVDIHWFTGNHDVWLRDYLRDEIGLTVHHAATTVTLDGHRLFLAHGDDVGRQPAMYRFTRWCFHNPVCQWLYAAIHPRWTTAVATGWSADNRTRRKPKREHRAQDNAFARLVHFAEAHHSQHNDVDTYIFGHLHMARQQNIDAGNAQIICLGDWLHHDTYAFLSDGTITLQAFHS
ncbi:MAG: UDP-2,3-diacylglucosamine diphosphatase [Muribaculaceae bacterium]|nr:UDP-2,3-diacylglucosamine diphosphatase [Muribaculaceae bacterium]